MYVKDILTRINGLLSNASSFKLSYSKLKFYLDGAIDHVNESLKTEYPSIDDAYRSDLKYNYAVCKGYVTLYIHKKDIKYAFDLSTRTLYDIENKQKYTGFADAVYIESEDKLFIKEYSKYTYHFDSMVPDSVIKGDINNIENFDYNVLPDRYIRSCVVYYAAALYLEEEDELEGQYQEYKSKAKEELQEWKHQSYSCYDTEW